MTKEERDQQIADLYVDGKSASALARDFALSVPSIRAIIAAKGVKASQRKKVENAEHPGQPVRRTLGRTHERLGETLAFSRAIELKHTRKEASERLGWTVHKVAAVETGRYEVTLTDLMDLSGYTKKHVGELIRL
ncbi:TPA: hypothetical protein ACYLN4_004004 [Burkholderia lata]|uniref:hypothetical protein n=1 Tax=Burkholderia sp. Bp8998 TaxID=2184557 RepID=UPI000F57F4A9|nr:hypothetical protein [Burkholderia sp. Bp8998]RQR63847.1 hypothetical protein DIE18_06870 [Burkholderia sp. Bp9125]RQS17087.1 hypothetical protein DIE06_18070 [Burkholderia sp. Bp8998]